MALPSTSTSPVEKLRWKLVASSCAFHRQNSTKLNREISLRCAVRFVSSTRVTSASVPRGTMLVCVTARPFFSAAMRV